MFYVISLAGTYKQHLSVVSIRSVYSVYCDHQKLYSDTCWAKESIIELLPHVVADIVALYHAHIHTCI